MDTHDRLNLFLSFKFKLEINQTNNNVFFHFNNGKVQVSKYLPHTIVSSDKEFSAQISGQWQLAELPSNVALQWAYLGHDNFEQGSPFGPKIDVKKRFDFTAFLITRNEIITIKMRIWIRSDEYILSNFHATKISFIEYFMMLFFSFWKTCRA